MGAILVLTGLRGAFRKSATDINGARDAMRETSGLAYGPEHGLLWTHNDANNPAELFGVDEQGRLAQRVAVSGAANEDWEDISLQMTEQGPMLWIADTGTNLRRPCLTVRSRPERISS